MKILLRQELNILVVVIDHFDRAKSVVNIEIQYLRPQILKLGLFYRKILTEVSLSQVRSGN